MQTKTQIQKTNLGHPEKPRVPEGPWPDKTKFRAKAGGIKPLPLKTRNLRG